MDKDLKAGTPNDNIKCLRCKHTYKYHNFYSDTCNACKSQGGRPAPCTFEWPAGSRGPWKKEASVDISDLFVKKPEETSYKTFETSAPEFLKEAAYEPGEIMESTIAKDWNYRINGLSDFVLAEQLTELELREMGKPVGENYAAYFQETLKDVKKNRKNAEKKLFKLIPRHSQLDSREFFERVDEQAAKEAEAKERSMEVYPPAGVAKLEHKDVARKGLKKEAADEAPSEGEMPGIEKSVEEVLAPQAEDPKMAEAVAELAQQAHAAGVNDVDRLKKWLEENHQVEALAWVVAHSPEAEKMIHDAAGMEKEAAAPTTLEHAKDPNLNYDPAKCSTCQKDVEAKKGRKRGDKILCDPCYDKGMEKEASAKWQAGQYLRAKHNDADACVANVDQESKIYIIKVCGTMSPSYYTFEEAYETFTAVDVDETKDGDWAKSHGLSKAADVEADLKTIKEA